MKASKEDRHRSGTIGLHAVKRSSWVVPLSAITIVCAITAFFCFANVSANAGPIEAWSQFNENGFADITNEAATAATVYDGGLYFGTSKEGGGCEVWRYDGSTWAQVNEDGFGDGMNTGIMSMEVYGPHLYAGTNHPGSPGGCEVWRYDGSTWTQVNEDGFGDSHNQIASSMVVYGGMLYVGTFNFYGCEVWGYDGSDWTQVNIDGFGDNKNGAAGSMSVFDGSLFIGTSNADGCEIWSYDGIGWTHEGIDGFGDSKNISAMEMEVNGACMFIGSLNRTSGCEVWSYNGASWVPVSKGGFGDIANTSVTSMEICDGDLYIGTGACELWRYDDDWKQVEYDGFGDENNESAYSMAVFDSSLYVGTYNWLDGCEVWRGSSQYSFYFAEGYTGQGAFDEYLCLMNPNATDVVARVTYMFTDGSTQVQDVPIKATSRATVNVNGAVGPDREVSVKVTSEDAIVAERPMYFNYDGAWTGGHDVMGAYYPKGEFYFAEGYTGQGVFDEYLCLMNPNATDVVAQVTYMFTDGSTQVQDVPIKATSRATVNVNEAVGPDREVSVMVKAGQPIVAERPMYFNYDGAWTGGHDVIGYTP